MAGVLQASFDGKELAPIFSTARKRWRLAFTILRALYILDRNIVAKKRDGLLRTLTRSPSYTAIHVEPGCFFSISLSSLSQLVWAKNLDQLLQFGAVEGVVLALATDAEKGIPGDVQDIAHRHKAFGSNTYQKPPIKTLHIVLEAFKDPIIIILFVCGMLSLGFGIKKKGLDGWPDGGTILAGVFLSITISALSKLWPRRLLNKLSINNYDTPVDVIRNGQRKYIPKFDIVVGDVVCLKIGDKVPANGLFIEGHSLQVYESIIRGESDCVGVDCIHNPFLLSGTKVASGQARMLVTSVGMNTARGEMMSSISCDNQKTPLQAKLKRLTLFIALVGIGIASAVLVQLLAHYFVGHMNDDNGNCVFKPGETSLHGVFDAVVGILATPVAMASAAIPEGLLLAVTITLAYSTTRMADDQALVRNLSACEEIALITVISL